MNSVRTKLLCGIVAVIFISQMISAITIWHESIEHIEIMLNSDLTDKDRKQKVNHEIREIVVSIFLITGFSLLVSIIIVYSLIMQLTSPLDKLVRHLKNNDFRLFKPIEIDTPPGEITMVKETINHLFLQIKSRFEQERRFTSDVAHELRTPLAGLRIHLELMARTDLNALKLIDRIDEMMKSIELLFQLSRTEEKILTGRLATIDLIESLIEPLREEFDESFENTLFWEYPKQCNVEADAGLLQIALRNLLNNVKKHAYFSNHNLVRVSSYKECIRLEVIDSGAGVDNDKIKYLSLSFESIDTYNNKGWGIGLNLVKRIVKAHIGRFDILNRTDGHTGLHIIIDIPKKAQSNLESHG
ncbi:ATP-binding protein [Thorsellia anophelis]|uniref:histidine kinase n=1 Tax=Thorsellia anophelis DSM 18579 TaxID=1123402 RepID=A0A1I0F7J3_9GAMM|nr:ATP-binding protein [Thorsellia anophelis]SET53233.1 two-component system, OmpR family, sensor histidine kinase BasS [Thorsellia anophelis DSM 18579]